MYRDRSVFRITSPNILYTFGQWKDVLIMPFGQALSLFSLPSQIYQSFQRHNWYVALIIEFAIMEDGIWVQTEDGLWTMLPLSGCSRTTMASLVYSYGLPFISIAYLRQWMYIFATNHPQTNAVWNKILNDESRVNISEVAMLKWRERIMIHFTSERQWAKFPGYFI